MRRILSFSSFEIVIFLSVISVSSVVDPLLAVAKVAQKLPGAFKSVAHGFDRFSSPHSRTVAYAVILTQPSSALLNYFFRTGISILYTQRNSCFTATAICGEKIEFFHSLFGQTRMARMEIAM